ARELCVLSCENSLDDDRKAVAREPLEVVPAETRVEVPAEEVARDGEVLGNFEVDAKVALSPPEVGRIDREHERGEGALDCFGDQVLRLRAIGEDVDLEPARRARRGGGDLSGSGSRRGRETHDRASRSCRA